MGDFFYKQIHDSHKNHIINYIDDIVLYKLNSLYPYA